MDRRGTYATGPIDAIVERADSRWRRFVLRQTPYSFVSSLIPLLLAVVFAFDMLIGHPHFQYGLVLFWMVVYLIAALIPLLCGRHYPGWAGVAMTVGIQLWALYILLAGGHPHSQVNAMTEMPMLALYIGWFYSALLGRVWLLVTVAAFVSVLIFNPDLGSGVYTPGLLMLYALLVAVFCFEGARTVRRQVFVQGITDPLTRALNRRGLGSLEHAMRRAAARAGEPVAACMLDFDEFKQINDLGGHSAGDRALQESVLAWKEVAGMVGFSGRRGGLVARLGGDEFLLLMSGTPGEVEARIRAVQEASEYSWSWGVVEANPEEALEDVMVRADRELYGGRDTRKKREPGKDDR